ncbi:MAG: hypothetical protein Q8O56_06260 [Solirubrobacteraceae bacterium]|nr:hypothetical protein [Solirubrobacteraceae bacterium]
MALNDVIPAQIERLLRELDKRAAEHRRLRPYAERVSGHHMPIPEAVTAAKLTRAYRQLLSMSETPWGKLVVASKLDRLEVNGITSPDSSVSDAVWHGVWQTNAMDLESKLAHRAALMDGRAHATVWPAGDWVANDEQEITRWTSEEPRVTLDDSSVMVVEYVEGSRRERIGALRRWRDPNVDGRDLVTLYRRDGIYKFQQAKTDAGDRRFTAAGVSWEPREVDGEEWPLPNPLGVVPVVELGVNRQLAPGAFTHCSGEFANETGLIDKVNLLTFLGLVVAVSMSFPLRVLIGEEILRDDSGKAIPPFDAYIGGAVQFENPQAKLAQYEPADRGALSIYGELQQLAKSTSTPGHYFPLADTISNVSAETIRAFEGPLHAAVNGSHKPSLGEGWEEVLRLGGRMLPEPVELSQRAAIMWADHESRSLAERADAFSKIAGSLPWQAAAELALALGNDQIRRYESEQAGSALTQIIARLRDDDAARSPESAPLVAT